MAQAAEKIDSAASHFAEVESLKALDRLNGEFAELAERFKDGFVLERCSWSEAYAEGRISLIMYFNWSRECLVGRKALAGHKPTHKTLAALIFNAHPGSKGLVDRRNDQAMLVDTIKLGEFPQQKLTSLVRLYHVENELRELGHSRLYRSVMSGRYYLVPRFGRGQRHPFLAGYCDHDVIECGSQVMNDISDNERDTGWELCHGDSLDALLSGLGIVLNRQSCEVRIQKGAALTEKFVDVVLGPLGF